MSSSVIYFGIQPTAKQEVADDVKAKGLNFLRVEPSKVITFGHPTTIQPNFAVYKSHLPLFIEAAMSGTKVTAMSNPFIPINARGLDILPIPFPSLYISWQHEISEEVRDALRSNGWKDTMTRGKTAMYHTKPSLDIVRSALETKPSSTTPAPENGINIFTFRKALLIVRLISTFLRIHQYPAFTDEEHEEEFNKHYEDCVRLS